MRTRITICLGLTAALAACGSATKNEGNVASGGAAAGSGTATGAGGAGPAAGPAAPASAIRAPRVPERALRMVLATRYVRIAADGALTVGEIPQAAFKDGLLDPAKLGAPEATTLAALRDDLKALDAAIDSKMRAPMADDPPPPPEPEPPGDDDPSGGTGTSIMLEEGKMAARNAGVLGAAYGDRWFATGPDDVLTRPLTPSRDPSMAAPLIIADPDRPARELLAVIRAAEAYASLAVTADGTHLRSFATRIEPGGLGMSGLGPMDAHPAVTAIGRGAAIAIDAYQGKTAKPDVFTWRGDLAGAPAALDRAVHAPDLASAHDMRLWFDDTFTVGAMVTLLDAMYVAGGNPVAIGDPAQVVIPDPSGSIGIGRADTPGVGDPFGMGGPGSVPRVRIGPVKTTGDAKGEQRDLARNRMKITYCYEKALLADPRLAGKVTLTFTITSDGTVAGARGNGVSPDVASCMRDVIQTIQFAKHKAAAQVMVEIDTAPAGG